MISFNPRVLNHYLNVAGIQFYISSQIHSSNGLLISPLGSLKSISKWHIRNQALFLAPQSCFTRLLHLIKWYYNQPNFSGQTLRDHYWLVCFCWDSQVALVVKNLPANAGDIRNEGLIPGLRRFPGRGMAPTPVVLPTEIPWTERPGGLQSIGSQRVSHSWSDLALAHTHVSTASDILCSRNFWWLWH